MPRKKMERCGACGTRGMLRTITGIKYECDHCGGIGWRWPRYSTTTIGGGSSARYPLCQVEIPKTAQRRMDKKKNSKQREK